VASDDGAIADRARFMAEGLLGRIAMMDARAVDDPAMHYERALELARRIGTASEIAWTHSLLSMALPSRGADHLDRALDEAQAALRNARGSGSPSAIGLATQAVGYVMALQGDPAAGDVLRDGLRRFSVDSESGRLSMLAIHEMRYGTPSAAADALVDTIRRARFEGDAFIVANAIDIAIPFFARQGDPTTSMELLGALEQGALPRLLRSGVPGEKRARAIARIEAQLTSESAEAARRRGAAMTVDEVLDHALARIAALVPDATDAPS
jgi:hypothetical protein